MSGIRRLVVGGLLLVFAPSACISSAVSRRDLPEAPIALVYWEPEAARRRAELIEVEDEDADEIRRGIAKAEWLGALLGIGLDVDPAGLDRYPGHLSLLNPRTGVVSRVEAAPAGSRPLAWSSDHRRLIFTTDRLSDRFHLYVYDRLSDEVRPLTHGDWIETQAVYGPDDRILYSGVAFSSDEVQAAIYETSSHGGKARIVAPGIVAHGLSWSPNGETLVFVRRDFHEESSRPSALVARALDPDAEDRILAPGRDPVFTPDGGWIIYSAPVRDGWKLRRIRADGTGRATLGQSTRDEWSPAVSPDGRFIVYVADEAGRGLLFVRRIDGSGDRVLMGNGGVESPVW